MKKLLKFSKFLIEISHFYLIPHWYTFLISTKTCYAAASSYNYLQVFFQRAKKAEYRSEKLYGYVLSKVWLPTDHAGTFDSQL